MGLDYFHTILKSLDRKALAEKTGLNVTTLYSYTRPENATREPNIRILWAVACLTAHDFEDLCVNTFDLERM